VAERGVGPWRRELDVTYLCQHDDVDGVEFTACCRYRVRRRATGWPATARRTAPLPRDSRPTAAVATCGEIGDNCLGHRFAGSGGAGSVEARGAAPLITRPQEGRG
jgi:hypothetical protein